MRRLKFILPFAAAALTLAIVAAASARPDRTASAAKRHEDQLQRHAQDRHRDPAHGRRRLPRQRAAELGEVRGQDARPADRPEDHSSSRATRRSSRARRRRRRWRRSSSPTRGRRRHRPVDLGRGRGIEHDVLPGRDRAHLAVGDAHDADEGRRPSEATPAFFRVVPADDIQGPTRRELHDQRRCKVKNVVLFDFQEPYSLGLADAVETVLKATGVDDVAPLGRRTRRRTSRRT